MRILPATEEALREAAKAIHRGDLVGMPTETVYGVAADALNPEAVVKTFAAKGRPAENPLIVHVASLEQARAVAKHWPPEAEELARRFWPGPLTLVLPKRPEVPDETTAGLGSVAIRMPAHPTARRLIELAGTPLSAPSANPFMGLSPTTAQAIEPAVAHHLALILDGGPCEVGIESTVLDLSGEQPRLLRPGQVPKEDIERAIGREVVSETPVERRSPGMYPRHYAPRAEVHVVERLEPDQAGLTFDAPTGELQIQMPSDVGLYARSLYQSLRQLDHADVGTIHVQAPPNTHEWAAVWDRLRKASYRGS